MRVLVLDVVLWEVWSRIARLGLAAAPRFVDFSFSVVSVYLIRLLDRASIIESGCQNLMAVLRECVEPMLRRVHSILDVSSSMVRVSTALRW